MIRADRALSRYLALAAVCCMSRARASLLQYITLLHSSSPETGYTKQGRLLHYFAIQCAFVFVFEIGFIYYYNVHVSCAAGLVIENPRLGLWLNVVFRCPFTKCHRSPNYTIIGVENRVTFHFYCVSKLLNLPTHDYALPLRLISLLFFFCTALGIVKNVCCLLSPQ